MFSTEWRPVTAGEMLIEEFLTPLGLTQGALAEAMGVQRKLVNELCNNRRVVTADTALMLARVRQLAGVLAQCAAPDGPVGKHCTCRSGGSALNRRGRCRRLGRLPSTMFNNGYFLIPACGTRCAGSD